MPTPFTHLWIAEKLLEDSSLPQGVSQLIHAERPAFLLGSIIADARPSAQSTRDMTHFYRYDQEMLDHPWRIMLSQHPELNHAQSPAHRAFIAGYVAHLAADEFWSLHMLRPHFAMGEWGESLRWRFYVLHLLLIFMDERDQARLASWQAPTLMEADPADWLPFMQDSVIADWRDYIAMQLRTQDSDTLEIFGQRVSRSADELREMLDSRATMQSMLWDHVTPDDLQDVEDALLKFSSEQMFSYLKETATP